MKLFNSKPVVLMVAFTGLIVSTYNFAHAYTPQRITINLPDPPRPLPDPPQPRPINFEE